MTNTSFSRPLGSRLKASASALVLALTLTGVCVPLAQAAVETNSVLGTYLAARLAQQLRDTDAANSLLKVALDRDPSNAGLLDEAFISEVTGGNWPKAVAYATRAVAAEPGNQLAHIVLGVDAFKAGRLGEAERHFTQPGKAPVAVMARAWVLIARKDTKTANDLLGSITEPNWIGLYRRLQSALMADVAGDSAGAGTIYKELFAADPSAIDITLDYAHHASHMGDDKLAAEILAKHFANVAQHHPLADAANQAVQHGETMKLSVGSAADGLADTFYGFSQALQGQGGIDLALIYTQIALQLKPNDQLTLFALAGLLEQQKKYDEAIAVYKRLPAGSPLQFDADIRAGLNLNALDKTEEAKTALTALADPAHSAPAPTLSREALHSEIENLAGVSPHEHGAKVDELQRLLGLGGYGDGGADGNYGPATSDAISKLQKSAGLSENGVLGAATRKALEERLAAAPQPAAAPLSNDRLIDLYSTIGRMLSGHKNFAGAADYFSKAIALLGKPEKANWDQYYSRAVCFERLNQWAKAEPDFQKAIDLNPNEPLILNYLGYSWVDRNEHIDQALDLIKKAVSLKPDDGYYVDSLGWAYFRMGRFDDAVQQLEHAVELKAADPTINDHLGDAYWRAGRKLEAQFQWSTALSSKPEPEDVSKIEAKLKDGLPPDPAAATAGADVAKPASIPADNTGTDKPKLP